MYQPIQVLALRRVQAGQPIHPSMEGPVLHGHPLFGPRPQDPSFDRLESKPAKPSTEESLNRIALLERAVEDLQARLEESESARRREVNRCLFWHDRYRKLDEAVTNAMNALNVKL